MSMKAEARRLMRFRMQQVEKQAAKAAPAPVVVRQSTFPTVTRMDKVRVALSAMVWGVCYVLTYTNPLSLPFYIGRAIARWR